MADPCCGRRVLIVDDEDDIAELFSFMLERRGYRCATAQTGRRALDLVESFRPDILLLDIGLPDIDGYQIAREVRASQGRGIFIAAVTGWGQGDDRQRALASGMDDHLTKPVSRAVLLEILARAEARGSEGG